MGLAKVLIGRVIKGEPKCARIDSLGLARRRLAGKAAQEELVIEMPDPEEPEAGTVDEALPPGQDPIEEENQNDDSDYVGWNFSNRPHRDSLRSHRRRFRQRASQELPSSRLHGGGFADKGASWSSGGSQSAPGDADEQQEEGGAVASSVATRQVRFRRASDGEYILKPAHKTVEAGLPNPLKVVQLKAERLFRRLTSNFGEPTRPRSGTPSCGPSPPRSSQRLSTGRIASTSRSSSSWIQSLRKRSVDVGAASGGEDDRSPTASVGPAGGTGATAMDGGDRTGASVFRAKRQSAPGEFFAPYVATLAADDTASPPPAPTGLIPVAGTPGRSRGGNWLAMLSRGRSTAPGQAVSRALVVQTTSPPTTPPIQQLPSLPSRRAAAAAAPTAAVLEAGCMPVPEQSADILDFTAGESEVVTGGAFVQGVA